MTTIATLTDQHVQNQLEFLRPLNRLQLKMIFADLPAAGINETIGEYSAALLNQDNVISNALTRIAFQAHGPWIGKAFRPRASGDTTDQGEGYNLFKDASNVQRKLQMDTHIGQSVFDNRQSMVLDYSKRHRGPIRWLIGELRQLDETTILGMGIFGLRHKRLGRYKRVVPFLLHGPYGEYRLT